MDRAPAGRSGASPPLEDLWHVFLNLGAQVTPATKGAKLQLLVHAEAVDGLPRAPSARISATQFTNQST